MLPQPIVADAYLLLAVQIIRQQAERGSFPSADEYHKAAKQRAQDNKLAVPRMPLL